VRRRAREVRSAIAARRQDCVLRAESVQRAVLQVERYHSSAFAVFHQEIQREVLDEVVAVVPERLAVESVQERVAGPVSDTATPVRLTAFAEVVRLTTESSLVNTALGCTAERHT